MQVIWNVTSKEDDPSHNEIAAAAREFSGKLIIAYAGGIMKAKGLRVALKAASLVKTKYPDCLFLFIGPFKDDADEVDKFIEQEDLRNNVFFRGSVSYRTLMK